MSIKVFQLLDMRKVYLSKKNVVIGDQVPLSIFEVLIGGDYESVPIPLTLSDLQYTGTRWQEMHRGPRKTT